MFVRTAYRLVSWKPFLKLFVFLTAHSTNPQNSTEPERLTCTHPVSGQYGLSHRIVYYVSFVVVITARRHEWISGAALASVMLFSSTAILHMMIIPKTKFAFPEVLDLDFFPISMIIVTALTLSMPLMYFSRAIARSKARPIMIAWIFWNWICATVAFVIFLPNLLPKLFSAEESYPSEHACLALNNNSTTNMKLLVSLDQLSSPGLNINCTYKCFYPRSPIRSPEDIIAINKGVSPKIKFNFPPFFSILSAFWMFSVGLVGLVNRH